MTFFWLLIASFLLSVALSPVAIYLSRKFNLMDDPKRHKHPALLHKKIIPRGGGISLFLTICALGFLVVPKTQQMLGIFLGALILVIAGLLDDRFDLGRWTKLFMQISAAVVVVFSGVGIAFVTDPFSFVGAGESISVLRLDTVKLVFDFLGTHSILLFADIFALIWIVWVINMVNFSSGVDGQMPGIVFITFLVLFIVSLRFGNDPSQITVSYLAIISAGATLGFLIFNFAPAKLFPGDSGSYLLGFMIAILAILSGAKVGTAVLVMAVPFADGLFTIIRRIYSGRSPFVGDRGHLHHKLLELGMRPRQIALFYWVLCAILGASALALDSAGKLFMGVVIGIILFGGLIWLNMTLPLVDRK